jgi:hypothetical protein
MSLVSSGSLLVGFVKLIVRGSKPVGDDDG